MANALRVGIVGCGNISTAYFTLSGLFDGFEISACADLNAEAAAASAARFGIRASGVEELLAADDIDLVVNLTVPAAHYQVSRAALEAGKHVYSEKPFVLSLAEGESLAALAAARGLRVGSAPDTFLGGAHQLARRIVDSGEIGRIVGGTAVVMSHGMEHWHPNPDFFYQPGAGPVLDIGPYYVTALLQLIGPVRQVMALSSTPARERTITSQPRSGQTIAVGTATTIHGLLEFANGALVTLLASWDVWSHGHAPIELYGEAGSLFLPDPNFFGGAVRQTRLRDPVSPDPAWDHPFGVPNFQSSVGQAANYRTAGLADMAAAIAENRPHRCSSEMALHAVEVMTGLLEAGAGKGAVAMRTTFERPALLDPAAAGALMKQAAPAG